MQTALSPSLSPNLSLHQIKTFTFIESRPRFLNRVDFPVLHPDRFVTPILVDVLHLEGHPSSLFKSGFHSKIPSLQSLQSVLVRAFNPVQLFLANQKAGRPHEVDIHRHLQDPLGPGWDRLTHITFKWVTLKPAICPSSFGGHPFPPSYPPWSIVFEVGPKPTNLPWSHQYTWLREVYDLLKQLKSPLAPTVRPPVVVLLDTPWDKFNARALVESWFLKHHGEQGALVGLGWISFATKVSFVVSGFLDFLPGAVHHAQI